MTRAAAEGGWGAALALVLVAALMVAAPPAFAEDSGRDEDETPATIDASAAPADDSGEGVDGLSVRVARGPSGLGVQGRCVVHAPASVAWDVLTDYDGISRFVSSMKESRVTGRGDHHILVEQVALGRLFLFRKRLRATLFVEETPRTRIRFQDVLGRDFEDYRGEWRIEERPGGVEIIYQLGARPRFSVPDFVARGMFKRAARELLSQVSVEIERRAVLGGPAQVKDGAPEADGSTR